MLDVMMIFYFTIFKNIFGLWFIFLLGIWNDAISGSPPGVSSLCYIVIIKMFFIASNKISNETFKQVWYQFIIFLSAILFLKWMFLSMFNSVFYNPVGIIIQLILTSLFYIVLHTFFDFLNKKLIEH
jgi:rod shape-determining protein MreD